MLDNWEKEETEQGGKKRKKQFLRRGAHPVTSQFLTNHFWI
jgi:hypothetical protein